MKLIFGFLILVSGCLFLCCKTEKQLEFNYPTTLSKEKLEELKLKVAKGSKLFNKNCASCHGINGKGKDTMINFTKTQIDSYNASFVKGDYKNHAFAQGLSNVELTDILLFAYLVKK